MGIFEVHYDFLVLCTYTFLCVCVCMCVSVCGWKPEVNLQVLFLRHRLPPVLRQGISPRLNWMVSVRWDLLGLQAPATMARLPMSLGGESQLLMHTRQGSLLWVDWTIFPVLMVIIFYFSKDWEWNLDIHLSNFLGCLFIYFVIYSWV